MINGKFYSGLTSQMMNRSRIVNRQETHFFWPDESGMEAVQSRKGRGSSTTTTAVNNNDSAAKNNNYSAANNMLQRSDSTDIKPKELFRKQLSSGIEFFDNVDAKTPESRRRRFKKIDNINLKHSEATPYQPEQKKLETFSSKIEFYDYDDEPVRPPLKSDAIKSKKSEPTAAEAKPTNTSEPIKAAVGASARKSDSPDASKKRITFQAEPAKGGEKTTRGILKKNGGVDEKSSAADAKVVEVKPLHKRGLLPKSLSKSVENLSKMAAVIENDVKANKPETLSAIIREVKSLNLATGEPRDARGRPSLTAAKRREYSPRRYDEYGDRPEYRDAEYRDRYDDGYDDGDYFERYEPAPRARVPYSTARDAYEARRQRDSGHRADERPVRGSRGAHPDDRDPRHGGYRDDRSDARYGSQRDSRNSAYSTPRSGRESAYGGQRDDRSPRYPAQRDDRSAGYGKHRDDYRCDQLDSLPPYEQALEEYGRVASSQSPKNLPHHLRTSILTNGLPRPQTQRPLSVRNSAVTRVGVGLPDYE